MRARPFAEPVSYTHLMTIVGGHQRLSCAIDLGYTEVPCAVVDVDKVREKALNIALNKITGAWAVSYTHLPSHFAKEID